MKVINANVTELKNINPQAHIESIGRICYKSESAITTGSAEKFVRAMYLNKHWAMLEHFRFIFEVPKMIYDNIVEIGSPYIVCTDYGRYVISASARGLLDAHEVVSTSIAMHRNLNYSHLTALMALASHAVWHYGCDELFGRCNPCEQPNIKCLENSKHELNGYHEWMAHGWHSVLLTYDRGVSHELVRHRPCSFAQESTRYCNYSKGKFGSELTVIEPLFFDKDTIRYNLWYDAMVMCERAYNILNKEGAKPEESRTVLPNSLKTDLVITATNSEWTHIVDLRYKGTTGAPHPQAKEVVGLIINKYDWAKEL